MDFYNWLAPFNPYSGIVIAQIDQLRTINELGSNFTVAGILFALVLGLAFACRWLGQRFYNTLLKMISEKREENLVLKTERDRYKDLYHESERRRYQEAIDMQKELERHNQRLIELYNSGQ